MNPQFPHQEVGRTIAHPQIEVLLSVQCVFHVQSPGHRMCATLCRPEPSLVTLTMSARGCHCTVVPASPRMSCYLSSALASKVRKQAWLFTACLASPHCDWTKLVSECVCIMPKDRNPAGEGKDACLEDIPDGALLALHWISHR